MSKEEMTKEVITKYSKAQILESSRFSTRRDALSVALDDSKQYTLEGAEQALAAFMKGKVN